MRKFRIKTISHQLKNQVIAKFGNLVNEDQLNGNAQELINGNFIEEVFDDVNEIEVVLPKEKAKVLNSKGNLKDVSPIKK